MYILLVSWLRVVRWSQRWRWIAAGASNQIHVWNYLPTKNLSRDIWRASVQKMWLGSGGSKIQKNIKKVIGNGIKHIWKRNAKITENGRNQIQKRPVGRDKQAVEKFGQNGYTPKAPIQHRNGSTWENGMTIGVCAVDATNQRQRNKNYWLS